MSLPRLSEESPEQPASRGGQHIDADRAAADPNSRGGESDQAGEKFTEEELAIHARHREACEVSWNAVITQWFTGGAHFD